ncbi:MAG: heavy metal-binding domain-containing protein, partial [Pirellulaceae bacterium]|nr:heavy metal-binding domain-containing protein [Pirellulaceae bacterium]
MIVVTTETIHGRDIIDTLGLVRGNTIRARHVGRDIVAGLKTLVGGEIHEYAKLMGEAREQALDQIGRPNRETKSGDQIGRPNR